MEERSFGKAGRPAKGRRPVKAGSSTMEAAWVPLTERRTANRRRALEAGKLGSAFDKPGDCTVTDLSGSGANVLVKVDVNYIPKKVLLILLRKRVAYTATVAWRKADRIGLKFVREHDLQNPTTPELEALGRYCAAQHATI